MGKIIAIAVLSLASTPGLAQGAVQEICENLGSIAESAGEMRDKGVSQAHLKASMLESMNERRTPQDVIQATFGAINYAFERSNRGKSPALLNGEYYRFCTAVAQRGS